jgi:hypothetical protein
MGAFAGAEEEWFATRGWKPAFYAPNIGDKTKFSKPPIVLAVMTPKF